MKTATCANATAVRHQDSGGSHTYGTRPSPWALIDAAPDGVIVVEDGGRIVVANRRAEALFGYAHGELLMMSVEGLVPEPLRLDHSEHRSKYATEPQSRPMGAGCQLLGRRRDGTTFPIDISLSPVYKDRARIVIVSVRALRDPTGHDRELVQASSRRLGLLADQILEGLCETAFSLHAATGSAVDTEYALGKLDDLIRLVHTTVLEDTLEHIDLSDV